MLRTWDEFWGDVFLRQLPELAPDLERRRAERAEWLWATLGLYPGARVLDLGCGNGMVGVCLARRGAHITGVDRLEPLLARARAAAGDLSAIFERADLRNVSFPEGSFDAILLLEVLGLMSRADDASLLHRAAGWLAAGGRIMLDCPHPPGTASRTAEWDVSDGRVTLHTTFDRSTRLLHLEPTFHASDGTTIGLHDPYDPSRPDHSGVLRYLYPEEELRAMLEAAGLAGRRLPHPFSEGHFVLLGAA
ncbi:MAG: class I SAM-dependent methyltransferase [Armatimonadetes bacterium]|nr:class I SAM-dependent methyltransferase [Armatimonadota bacterium]